jgi:uncharacterized protein YbbC (DUF1343 family)
MVLLEGTELSEGRGTTRPFEIVGAPWVEPELLAARLRAAALPGCLWRPLHFEPTFQKHAGRVCGGVQLHVTERDVFSPLLAAMTLLAAVREIWPERTLWRSPPYEYETERPPIDVIAGGPWLREAIDAGRDPRDVVAGWKYQLAVLSEWFGEHRLYG